MITHPNRPVLVVTLVAFALLGCSNAQRERNSSPGASPPPAFSDDGTDNVSDSNSSITTTTSVDTPFWIFQASGETAPEALGVARRRAKSEIYNRLNSWTDQWFRICSRYSTSGQFRDYILLGPDALMQGALMSSSITQGTDRTSVATVTVDAMDLRQRFHQYALAGRTRIPSELVSHYRETIKTLTLQ